MVPVKSFATLTDAERFLAGENPSQAGASSAGTTAKFYAVKSGRIPGIYTDWLSAQEQITGWQKPKHRSFATKAEAQRFLDEDGSKAGESPEGTELDMATSGLQHAPEGANGSGTKPPAPKRGRKALNGSSRAAKPATPEYNEEDFEPGTGPLPPGAEDGFDPNIILDPDTGNLVYKTLEQRNATKPRPGGQAQFGTLRIHTDGSSLGNGKAGAFAGVGVYFGPSDAR